MRVLFVNLNNKLSQNEDFLIRLREMQAVNNLACMANVAVQERHAVKILDYDIENVENDHLVQDAKEYKPHVVVIHLEDEFIEENLKVVDVFKAGYAGSKIVVHNNYLFHMPLSDLSQFLLDSVDAIVREEPDDVLPKLLEALLDNYPIQKVSNLRYKNEDKKWKATEIVFFNHLDAYSIPYRKGLKNELYKNIDNTAPLAIVKAGRGSNSKCIYESTARLEGEKIRTRSPESISREIEIAFTEFGIKDFYIDIDDFNHDENWAIDVAQEIRASEAEKLTLMTRLQLKNLNRNVAEQMNFAGFNLVIVNMCSAAEETLRRAKVGVKSDFYKSSLEILHYYGIKTYAIYRIGFPWEMKKHIEETTKMISDFAHTYLDFKVLTPTCNTESMEMLKDEGLLGEQISKTKYSITGTKYLKKKDVEGLYKGFQLKNKLFGFMKKEKINEDLYKLSDSDKKIKNKKNVRG